MQRKMRYWKYMLFCSFSLDILSITDVRWRSDLSREDLDESKTLISVDYFWCILGWFAADVSCLPSCVWDWSWSYPLWRHPTLLVITVVYWGKAVQLRFWAPAQSERERERLLDRSERPEIKEKRGRLCTITVRWWYNALFFPLSGDESLFLCIDALDHSQVCKKWNRKEEQRKKKS